MTTFCRPYSIDLQVQIFIECELGFVIVKESFLIYIMTILLSDYILAHIFKIRGVFNKLKCLLKMQKHNQFHLDKKHTIHDKILYIST